MLKIQGYFLHSLLKIQGCFLQNCPLDKEYFRYVYIRTRYKDLTKRHTVSETVPLYYFCFSFIDFEKYYPYFLIK